MREMFSRSDDPAFHQICRRVVGELIERYEWALLSEDDLVNLVLSAAQPGTSPDELERLAKHHYTRVLYEACRQDEDPHRRERAYHDLFRYLFRAAHNRWPDLAEDATQRALILVYEQIDRCREPGTFLAFALWKLRHAFQIVRRARGKEIAREDVVHYNSAQKQPSAHSHLAHKERLRVLAEAISRIPDECKRKAIVLKFVGGLSDEEIGARLDVTVGYVRVLRHRGVARLRKDERLKGYFEIDDEDEEI